MGYELISISRLDEGPSLDLDSEAAQAKLYRSNFKAWFNFYAWPLLLSLARSYGWRPKGTLLLIPIPPDDPEDWEGCYCTIDGQEVTTDDAEGLAKALALAIDDIPDNYDVAENYVTIFTDEEAKAYLLKNHHKSIQTMLGNIPLGHGWGVNVPNVDLTPLEYFSGKEKQHVIDFIALCKKGGFVIW